MENRAHLLHESAFASGDIARINTSLTKIQRCSAQSLALAPILF